MDYEKAYKQALERAKKIRDEILNNEIIGFPGQITEIFPELAESESEYEKIRKEIVSIVQSYRDSCIIEGSHRFDVCLAWLEKQKPSAPNNYDEKMRKKIIDHLESIKMGCVICTIDTSEEIAWLEKLKGLDKMIVVSPEVWDNAISDAFENGKKEGEKQKEPHYTKRNALFNKCVENCDPEVMKEVSNKVDEMLGKEQKEPLTPLAEALSNFLKNDFEFFARKEWNEAKWNEVMNTQATELQRLAYLEKQKEQKPISQEDFDTAKHEALWGEQKPAWSEEDEKIRRNLMSLLANMRGDRITEETYQKYYPWLNALRPGWKPTEVQMDALAYAIQILDDGLSPKAAKAGEELEHLREQLKKL